MTTALNFQLYGINYTLRIGPDWDPNRCKSPTRVASDLQQLQSIAQNVRIFSLNDCDAGNAVLTAAAALPNMGVWLGLWVGPNGHNFDAERTVLLQLLSDEQSHDWSRVRGIHVSSEAIYRGDLTVQQAVAYRNIIKADLVANGWPDIPVVVADIASLYSCCIGVVFSYFAILTPQRHPDLSVLLLD